MHALPTAKGWRRGPAIVSSLLEALGAAVPDPGEVLI